MQIPKPYNKILAIDATWLLRRQFMVLNKGILPGTGIEAKDATDTEPAIEAVPRVQDPMLIVSSFLTCVLKDIREANYEYETYCLWDRGTYRYRPKSQFVDYKVTRVYDDSFQCCWDATDIARDLMRRIGIHSIQVAGCEADDLGMFYSHNSESCILRAIDSDWLQSITPTTRIKNKSKDLVTYDDVIKNHILYPGDIAIEKAINGGHDDLATVALPDGISIGDGIRLYKTKELPVQVMNGIDYNMQLSRLDKILSDTEAHEIIKTQEAMTKYPKTQLDLIKELTILGTVPPHFLGPLVKYNKLFGN